jgi:muramoyltetrapeptide carboxypeptidase LdcA involved in peptidoglycan recycling
MKRMAELQKLRKGDKVAVLSPSFAAPGAWPHVYELGLKRLREIFELEPIEFPTTRKPGATAEEKSKDLLAAFESKEIKAVIASIGGDHQVTYVKNLPREPFVRNPKPYFGYSDNTHVMNFLWLNGIPSYYGGSILTQFAMQTRMDAYTVHYLKQALFQGGEQELEASATYNDIGLPWDDPTTLGQKRTYEPNERWIWDGNEDVEGTTWGGCLESIDELLRHGIAIPSLDDFKNVILMTETSEEIPTSEYVFRVYRALGERGILARVRGVLVGRPKAWEFNNRQDAQQKREYRTRQRVAILKAVRMYNAAVPVIQNLDFGHTDPQIPMPYGRRARIRSSDRKILVTF